MIILENWPMSSNVFSLFVFLYAQEPVVFRAVKTQKLEVNTRKSEVERSAVREERGRSEFHLFLSFDISPNDVKHVKVNIVCKEIEGCPILSPRLQSYPLAFHWKTGSLVVKHPTKCRWSIGQYTRIDSNGKIHFLFVKGLEKFHSCCLRG